MDFFFYFIFELFFDVTTRRYPSQSNSPVDQIKWVIKEQITMFQTKIQELYVKVEGKEYAAEVVTVDKLPGSYLIGTWERKGTVSISRLEGIDVSYIQRMSFREARSNFP